MKSSKRKVSSKTSSATQATKGKPRSRLRGLKRAFFFTPSSPSSLLHFYIIVATFLLHFIKQNDSILLCSMIFYNIQSLWILNSAPYSFNTSPTEFRFLSLLFLLLYSPIIQFGTGIPFVVSKECTTFAQCKSGTGGRGETGRHDRLRIYCCEAWGFESPRPHFVVE